MSVQCSDSDRKVSLSPMREKWARVFSNRVHWAPVLLGLALFFGPIASPAQPLPKAPRIGVLSPQKSTEPAALQREPFERGLRELGWTPGKNVIIENRYAEGEVDRLPELAAELVRLPVDTIVARAPQGIRAAQRATSTIPIVMSASSDPVRAGFVASLANPGGNITGMAIMVDDLGGKQLSFLKEAYPRLARVGVVADPAMMSEQETTFFSGLEATARTLKIEIRVFKISKPADIAPVFVEIDAARIDAILVRPDPHVLEPNAAQIVTLAAQHRIPAMYPWRFYVEAGGLMSYATTGSQPEFHHRSATYVDKILRGAKLGTLPVEQPLKFELVINRKTAQALGLTLSSTLLVQANEVIQ